MKKLNYLSQEYVDLEEKMEYKVSVNVSKYLKPLGWDDCNISVIEARPSWQYYLINFKDSVGGPVAIKKNSNCRLQKIEAGLYKGCYCIIESQDNPSVFTILCVFDDKKVLRYPEFKKKLSVEQVDEMLKKENIERQTAEILNTVDLFNEPSAQFYQVFCKNLPDGCWNDPTFSKNVLKYFDQCKEVKFDNLINPRYINVDICKNDAREFFENLAKKKTGTVERTK